MGGHQALFQLDAHLFGQRLEMHATLALVSQSTQRKRASFVTRRPATTISMAPPTKQAAREGSLMFLTILKVTTMRQLMMSKMMTKQTKFLSMKTQRDRACFTVSTSFNHNLCLELFSNLDCDGVQVWAQLLHQIA